MKAHLFLGTAALATLFSVQVGAQTAQPVAPVDGGQEASASLADIIVTAQRKSESLQRAALPISAVSGDALISAGVTKATELTNIVPSLQIAPSAGPYAIFYLRGVGNFSGNALSDAAVAFNVDGVYIGRPSGTTGFFYDLDRAEVLKGPQGTLYGRNATGGAINIITRRPEIGQFGAAGSVDIGNYSSLRLDGSINLPVSDNAALRVAGTYVKHDAYMDDGTDNQKDAAVRASFRVEPTSTLTVDIVGDYSQQRGRGVGGTPVQLGVDNRDGYFSPAGVAFLTQQPNLTLGRSFAPLPVEPFMRNSQWGIASTVEWRTSIGTVTVVPAHREGKLDYRSATPGFYVQQTERDKQTSVEARLASTDERPIRYLLGLYYYHENNEIPQYYVNQQANVNSYSYDQEIDAKAIFGRLTYAFTPDIRITGGLRYSREVKDFAGQLFGAIRVCVLPTGCPTAQTLPYDPTSVPSPNFNPAVDGTVTIPSFIDNAGANAKRLSVGRTTFRLGADWDVTSRNLLYASYETGFKTGGFFFSADDGTFRPEKIEAWTLGSKNRFFDNRLQLNLEAFYWRYNDQQISHLVNDSTGNAIFATENVGRATYKGIEIDARYLLTPTTELNVDVQYLDAVYKDFVYQTPNLNGGVYNGTSCPNVGTPGTSYTVDCSGKRPPYAPKWVLNLGGRQTVELEGGHKIVGTARAHYQSDNLTGLEFTTTEMQEAYWQVDGDLTFSTANGRLAITGYINNAFNKTVIANTFPTPFSLFTSASLRPPRTFGVRLALKY